MNYKLITNNRKSEGFTLVELLVVIAVMSIFGLLILNIFTQSLRGSNKSQIIGVIKQNGQAVLETMDKAVREADNVICLSDTLDTMVAVKNGIYTRYIFSLPSSSTNGLVEQDNPVKLVLNVVPAREETDAEFINRVCLAADPLLPTVIVLTDTNTKTGISVIKAKDTLGNDVPFFTRNKQAGFRDTINIRFALKPGIQAPLAIAGQIDPVNFETTVQLR